MVFAICTLLIFVVITGCISFSNYLERRHYIYAAILTASLSFFTWLTKTIIESEENYGTIGVYWGSLIVASGWIITNEISIANSRKQHTVNLMTAYFTNAQMVEDRNTIRDILPSYNNKMTPEVGDFTADNQLIRAINRELNFLEFLAAALERRDLDETLFKDCLGQIVINVYRQMEAYINYWRDENSQWWSYLAALYKRWTEPERCIWGITWQPPASPYPPASPHPTTTPAH
jgi:hypothetical protein